MKRKFCLWLSRNPKRIASIIGTYSMPYNRGRYLFSDFATSLFWDFWIASYPSSNEYDHYHGVFRQEYDMMGISIAKKHKCDGIFR